MKTETTESAVDIVTLTARLHGLQMPDRRCGCGFAYEETLVHSACRQHDRGPLLSDLLDAIGERFRELDDSHGETLVGLFRRTNALTNQHSDLPAPAYYEIR